MRDFENKDYKIFEMFQKQWALVTAGNIDKYNSCTVSWGSLGTLWTRPQSTGSVATVYLHPARYTRDIMLESDNFTISFFPQDYNKALGIMGSKSGRDMDKAAATGLTPVAIGNSVTYKEANLTFVCRKIYQHQLTKDDLADDIKQYYINDPKAYPLDEDGLWQPHWVFIGEITEVEDKR